MPRRRLNTHPRCWTVVLNLRREVVCVARDVSFESWLIDVLRCGGQLLRIPESKARHLRMWEVLEVTQVMVYPATPRPQAPPVSSGEHGSPFD